jgi:hypothetical protein
MTASADTHSLLSNKSLSGVCYDDNVAHGSTKSRNAIPFLAQTLAENATRPALLKAFLGLAFRLSGQIRMNFSRIFNELMRGRLPNDMRAYTRHINGGTRGNMKPMSVLGFSTFSGTVQVFRKRAKSARVLCKPVLSMHGIPAVHTRHAAPWVSTKWPRGQLFRFGGVAPVCMLECHRVTTSGKALQHSDMCTATKPGLDETRGAVACAGEPYSLARCAATNELSDSKPAKMECDGDSIDAHPSIEPDDRISTCGCILCGEAAILSLVLSAHRDTNSGEIVWGGWVRTSDEALVCLDACKSVDPSSKTQKLDMTKIPSHFVCELKTRSRGRSRLVVKLAARPGEQFAIKRAEDTRNEMGNESTSGDPQTWLVDVDVAVDCTSRSRGSQACCDEVSTCAGPRKQAWKWIGTYHALDG